jgi:hypothetical protein
MQFDDAPVSVDPTERLASCEVPLAPTTSMPTHSEMSLPSANDAPSVATST